MVFFKVPVKSSNKRIMANTRQAGKRAGQTEKRRQRNASLSSAFRSAVKKVRKAIEAKDKATAESTYQAQVSIIDSIADKDIVHKNTAARLKSRLVAQIRALG